MYLYLGNVGYACKVFDGISHPDAVLWNTMISGLVRKRFLEAGIRVFCDMVRKGSLFDLTTLAVVLSGAAELQELRVRMTVQGFSIKNGLDCHVFVVTGLISLYAKCREMLPAKLLSDQIEQPNLVSYNAMISGFSSNSEIASAVSFFSELVLSGEKVNSSFC